MIFLSQTCLISGYTASFPDPKNPKLPDQYYILAFLDTFWSKQYSLFSLTLLNITKQTKICRKTMFSLPRSKTNAGLGYVPELPKTETQVGHVFSYVLFKSATFDKEIIEIHISEKLTGNFGT